MLNMAHSHDLPKDCALFSPAFLDTYIRPGDLMFGPNPYANVFHVSTLDDVPRALGVMRRDFVVGTTANLEGVLKTLARHVPAADATFFANNLVHEHNSKKKATV